MIEAFKGLLRICDTPKGTSKVEVLKEYANDKKVKYLLYVLLSPRTVFSIKKLQRTGFINRLIEPTQESLKLLVSKLRKSHGDAKVINDVLQYVSLFPIELQETVSKFFCKTLKIGVTAVTVNKVFPNLIEEFSCMLADTGDLPASSYPVVVDTKWDGVRCIAEVYNKKCTLFTRQGNIIDIPDIEDEFIKLSRGVNVMFDCELISTVRTEVSGKINSILKKGYSPEKADGIIAKVFDMVNHQCFLNRVPDTTSLIDRLLALEVLFSNSLINLNRLQLSTHVVCNTPLDVDKAVAELYARGEEGGIKKPLNSPYEFKRSKYWLKEKAVNVATLQVVGVKAGTNAREGKIGSIICESKCKKLTVNVGSGFTEEDLDILTEENIIGKFVDVKFNVVIKGEDSNTYSLFLPVLKEKDWMRIDKTEADTLERILKDHIGKPMID